MLTISVSDDESYEVSWDTVCDIKSISFSNHMASCRSASLTQFLDWLACKLLQFFSKCQEMDAHAKCRQWGCWMQVLSY